MRRSIGTTQECGSGSAEESDGIASILRRLYFDCGSPLAPLGNCKYTACQADTSMVLSAHKDYMVEDRSA